MRGARIEKDEYEECWREGVGLRTVRGFVLRGAADVMLAAAAAGAAGTLCIVRKMFFILSRT
jgi:hypothetical protein